MESVISEDLKEIPGFKGYFISKDGKVFSSHYSMFRKHPKIHEMILKEDKDGYLEVGLYKKGKRYFRRVHRLVLETWSTNPNNYTQVNHKDGNVKNNNINNLEWCTLEYNMQHSFHVLHRKPNITTNKKVLLINKLTGETIKFFSIKECAKYIGMSYVHLGKILNNTYNLSKSRKLKDYLVQYEV